MGAQSEYFLKNFAASPGAARLELPQKYNLVHGIVRFCYFGGSSSLDHLTAEDTFELLLLAEDLRISAFDTAELLPAILPSEEAVSRGVKGKMTPQASLNILRHEGLTRHPEMQAAVCNYVGNNLLNMITSMPQDQLHSIPAQTLPLVLRAACRTVFNHEDAQRLITFCLGHQQLESACDLLRETKQWNWGGTNFNTMCAPPNEEPSEGLEWHVMGVRSCLENTPARIILGEFFDWCVRLDYGAEGRLRIVYESAALHDGEQSSARSMNCFPAATFAWKVVFRGQDVFNEKPVFICFPENVSLHWSTTLPVNLTDLSESDDLHIQVYMAENPMLSLILYFFSSDLKSTIFSEDILNRLPHIEYRCLSSYSLVKTHIQN